MLSLPRREVLGAVAAAWGISYTDQIKLYLDERSSAYEEDEVTKDQDYPRSTVLGDLSGSGTSYHTAPHNTEIQAGIYPKHTKPISVEIDTGVISAGVALDSQEAEEIAMSLVDAIEEVEQWRHEQDYTDPLEGFERGDK